MARKFDNHEKLWPYLEEAVYQTLINDCAPGVLSTPSPDTLLVKLAYVLELTPTELLPLQRQMIALSLQLKDNSSLMTPPHSTLIAHVFRYFTSLCLSDLSKAAFIQEKAMNFLESQRRSYISSQPTQSMTKPSMNPQGEPWP